MPMRHHYLSVWNAQQVTFVKIQQNLLSSVKMEHTVKGILPIALCALQVSGTDICSAQVILSITASRVGLPPVAGADLEGWYGGSIEPPKLEQLK